MTTPLELAVFAVAAYGLWFVAMRTELGRRARVWLGSGMARAASGEPPEPTTSSGEDHDFLLARCNGSEQELLRRLEVETRRNPDLSDAEVYRKAIRSWFVEKRGGTHGAIAEELDDTWL